MEKNTRKKGLGKGLGALIPDADLLASSSDHFFYCEIEEITPNPYQPRQNVRDKAFEELVDSVRERGILQPLLVRSTEKGYQIIAGERRWRAAQVAGLQRVPVVIRDTAEPESFELALIENIQRKDLNPIEEGEAYQRLQEDFSLSQEEIAKKIGKDRSTVANMIRLLKLPDKVRNDLVEGVLSMGHARALLALPDSAVQLRARNTILKKGLSVRETEKLVQSLLKKQKKPKVVVELDSHMRAVLDQLIRHFGTKVTITRRGKRGRIEIEFYSDQDLQRILDLFQKGASPSKS
ncbi:MAG: ParB/RepB/Spo0J family partition protein [Syntrophobacterales bacterium]|jgi:ParB family chromosome partitioning protein